MLDDVLEEGRCRILVADGEPGTVAVFTDVLAPCRDRRDAESLPAGLGPDPGWTAPASRFELTVCAPGEKAVEAAAEAGGARRPFAVAFLDLGIEPGPSGLLAAERIREIDPLVQIVLTSSRSDLELLDAAASIPPADRLLYLQKPFHPQELKQIATSLCAKWQAEQRSQSLQTDLMGLIEAKTNELAAANDILRHDMLEFERTKKMIVRAKMEWESTFDSVQDLIAILDRDLRLKRLNKALARRLGLEPREAVGMASAELFDRPDRPGEVSAVLAALADQGFHTEELPIPRLGGDFLLTVSPFLVQDGELMGTIIVAHDITRHKILEAQLRQSQKMEAIGTLAGGIAHDFNNILGIIMGYTEMMLDAAPAASAMDRRLRQVLQASVRARDLVRQILTFSRQGDQELRPLRIGPLVKEILKLLGSTLPPKVRIVQCIMPGQAGPQEDTVLAEPTQIQQIVMNLCTNAAHAMRENGGAIEVSLAAVELDAEAAERHPPLAPGPFLRLSVRDTGHGIPPEVIDRIFDPFFTTKRTGEGTGMGLSVVHGIVQRHKGAVVVQSEPGQGSTFHIFLPRAGARAAEAQENEQPLPTGHGRILFVDDETDLADIGREHLERLGYQVTATTDAARALELLAAAPEAYDLLVTDQAMPRMNGTDLARQALALRPGLPVILCTGYAESLSFEEAKAAGIREFLLKPLLRRRLAESVSRALGGGQDKPEETPN